MGKRRHIFAQVVLLSLFLAGSVYGTDPNDVWHLKFDFGSRTGRVDDCNNLITPPPGYLYVDPYTGDLMNYGDHQIVYLGKSIDGADYGFTNNDPNNVSISIDNEASCWATTGSTTNLALTSVRFAATYYDNTAAGAFFELQVPNGDYVVTVGGGRAGRDRWNRMEVEGNVYKGDDISGTNLYILDIAPDDPCASPVLTWTLEPDLVKHEPLDPNGCVRTWGGDANHPDFWAYAEILYLKREIITVSDGRLTVHGCTGGGDAIGWLNFLEVIPNNCDSVVAAGYSFAGDLSGDCDVDFEDYVKLANSWMVCNEPDDESCIKTW